jgi:membrane protein required for colicin V production
MNWLDILIIITLVVGVVGGMATGLIKGALSLVGLILGIIVAGRLYDDLAVRLTFIHSEAAANIAAFAIILLIIILLTAIVSQVLRAVVANIMLGWLDRLLGGLMGLLIGMISWGALLALWARFFGGGVLESSFLAPILAAKFPLVLALLPPEFDSVREFFG